MNPHVRGILLGGGAIFMVKTFGGLFDFLLNITITRLLGIEDAGVFFLMIAVVSIMAAIGRLGLDNVVLRSTAGGIATGKEEYIKRTFNLSLITIFIFTTALALGLSSVYEVPDGGSNIARLFQLSPVVWFAIPFVAIGGLCAEYLRGSGRPAIGQSLLGMCFPASAVVLVSVMAELFGKEAAPIGYMAGALLTGMMGYIITRQHVGAVLVVRTEELLTLLQEARPFLFISITNLIMVWAGVLVLGALAAPEDVAVFSVAVRVVMLTSIALNILSVIVAPKFAQYHELGEREELARVARYSVQGGVLTALPFVLVFCFFSSVVMGLFGNGFEHGGTVLMVLACGQLVNAATGSVGYLLMMTSQEILIQRLTFFASVFFVILAIVLVPFYGAIGAAIANAISVVILNVLMVYFAFRTTGILMLPMLYRG